MTSHIVRSYDAEFSELDRMTAQMGGLAEKLLADAFPALERRDPKLAEMAVASDRAIDDLERQLQERAIPMIAKRQPMANDLRHIMTVLRSPATWSGSATSPRTSPSGRWPSPARATPSR